MAEWNRDMRPMALVDWGLNSRNEYRPTPVIPQDGSERPEIRPSCLLPDGADVGEE